MEMGPLQMATTDELVKELLMRFDSALLVYSERPTNGSKHRNCGAIDLRYYGSLTSALGLSVLSQDMLKEISENGPEENEVIFDEEDDDEEA